MNNCGCNPACNPSSQSTEIPCFRDGATYLKGLDSDGSDITLTGNGVLVSNDKSIYYTDGSAKKGEIPINPPATKGAKSIIVSSGGKLKALGEDAEEGSTLAFINGEWAATPIEYTKNQFSVKSIKSGNRFAAFNCSTTGNVSLGYLNVTPETYLYIDADGNYAPRSNLELATNLIEILCEAIPEKEDDEEIISAIGCTSEGKIVKGQSTSGMVYLDPPVLVYTQNKHNGAIGGESGIVNMPPAGPVTAGIFTTNYIDVDVSLLTGYGDKAHSVLINLRAGVANHAVNGGWDLVMLINGFEHMRVPVAQSNDVRKGHNDVMVQIPENKIIRIDGIRQIYDGGAAVNERSQAEAIIRAFIF